MTSFCIQCHQPMLFCPISLVAWHPAVHIDTVSKMSCDADLAGVELHSAPLSSAVFVFISRRTDSTT